MDMDTVQRSGSTVRDFLSLDLLETVCTRFYDGTAALLPLTWTLDTALLLVGCVGVSRHAFRISDPFRADQAEPRVLMVQYKQVGKTI